MGFIGDFFNMIISRPLGELLKICYLVVHNYGAALILFTLITRLLLFPLAVKQQKGMAEMARMQPKMQELQKKYAKDKTRLNEEMQKLYSEEGYSPLSGCLPMLIQLPILWGLFGVIYQPLTYMLGLSSTVITKIENILKPEILHLAGISKPGTALSTLGQKLEIYTAQAMGQHMDKVGQLIPPNTPKLDFSLFGIPGINLSSTPTWTSVLIIIPILCYVTNFLSSWLSLKMNQAASAQQGGMNSKIMLVIMPIVSTWFSFYVPAGIGFCWIVTNLFMLIQILIINRFYSMDKLKEQANAKADQRRASRREAEPIETTASEVTEESDNDQKPTAKNLGNTRKPQQRPAGSSKNVSKKKLKEENKRRLAASRQREDTTGQKDE